MIWFWIGLALGVGLTIPFVVWAGWRTERRARRLAQRARAAERLAELGTLTGGLAHEIKNPLSSVGLNIQLIQEDLRDLARHHPTEEKFGRAVRRVDALARETQRLREILDDFLHFAGRMRLDLVETNINQLIAELADFFSPQAQAAGIKLRTQLAAHPPTCTVDPTLLKQALLNLMINATQAMAEARISGKPHGGCEEMIIRTDRQHALGQNEILIHVIDTGPGIPPDMLPKVFQPYFSTKKTGTGLGLPTTRRVIEEHHGAITIHSEVGRGSDFVITLPGRTG